jgi:hypothetical protein
MQGIGLLGECPATNANSRANREYQAISGCTTNVPTDGIGDDCGHFQEECLAGEIMTPIVDVDSVLSRLSIGWLEDAGYSVNYDEADASYGRNSLGTNPNGNCKCSATRKTLRQLSRSDRSNRVRSLGRYLDGSSDRTASSRKLSEKGYQAAAAFGTSYLSNKRASAESSGRAQLLNDHDVEYVGDQAVSVIYRENGHLHSVIVRRD